MEVYILNQFKINVYNNHRLHCLMNSSTKVIYNMFSNIWAQTPLKEVIVDNDQLVEVVVVSNSMIAIAA